ncbi:MAG: 50S ribosomal protein L10 [Verrucomicrobiales bacterium]|nr:50S ribosomal protein L10 [Verrucomicrobiales bacterium]
MKEVKQTIIDGLLEEINSSPFMLVADYSGMTVPQFADIRAKLAEKGAKFQVAKNTFVKRAADSAEFPTEIAEFLSGQTAIITGEEDVCGAAKVLKDAGKDGKSPTVRAGVLDGEFLDEAKVKALADLPSKEILQATLLGLLNQPGTSLVRVLNEPGSALARVLAAKQEKG